MTDHTPTDYRTLGYADAMGWAVVYVNNELRDLERKRPNPRHRHKTEQWERCRQPLTKLKSRLLNAKNEAEQAFWKDKSPFPPASTEASKDNQA